MDHWYIGRALPAGGVMAKGKAPGALTQRGEGLESCALATLGREAGGATAVVAIRTASVHQLHLLDLRGLNP